MSTCCSREEHEAIKYRVEYFMLETKGHQKYLGLLTGECRQEGCGSTLALQLCGICTEACGLEDALPWGRPEDEGVAHFQCAVRHLLNLYKTRAVIVIGKHMAKEFVK